MDMGNVQRFYGRFFAEPAVKPYGFTRTHLPSGAEDSRIRNLMRSKALRDAGAPSRPNITLLRQKTGPPPLRQ